MVSFTFPPAAKAEAEYPEFARAPAYGCFTEVAYV